MPSSAMQSPFLRHGAAQCGNLHAGAFLSRTAALARNRTPTPTKQEVRMPSARRVVVAAPATARVNQRGDGRPIPPPPIHGGRVCAPQDRATISSIVRAPRRCGSNGEPKVRGTETVRCRRMPARRAGGSGHPAPRTGARGFSFGDLAPISSRRNRAWSPSYTRAAICRAQLLRRHSALFADQPALAVGAARFSAAEAVASVGASRPRSPISNSTEFSHFLGAAAACADDGRGDGRRLCPPFS